MDLGGDISDTQISEIQRALDENLVVVFRDQQMSNDQHKAFGQRFGELHLHPANLARGVSHPEIVELRADADSKYAIGEGWHADVTCDERPPKGLLVIWAPKVTLTKPFKYNGLCFEAESAENLGVRLLRTVMGCRR